jgi:hypothetical protein
MPLVDKQLQSPTTTAAVEQKKTAAVEQKKTAAVVFSCSCCSCQE